MGLTCLAGRMTVSNVEQVIPARETVMAVTTRIIPLPPALLANKISLSLLVKLVPVRLLVRADFISMDMIVAKLVKPI